MFKIASELSPGRTANAEDRAQNRRPEVEVTKKQIHRQAYRFSIDFSLLGLAYGFLSQIPRFLFGNHTHLTNVLDFCLAAEIFQSHRKDWIFIRIFVCF